MRLSSLAQGKGAHLSFVHGFTQTAQSWTPVIRKLSDNFTCTIVDAPGHGNSTDGHLSLQECGDAIAETIPKGTLVGYSMGARMALHAALQHPEHIERLVLISGTPGIETEAERLSRITSDNTLADHIETVGVHQFIEEWLSNSLFSGLSREMAQIDERVKNRASGLAASLRFAGTGTQKPLWTELHQLQMPVLIVVGEDDDKFVSIGQRMAAAISHSTFEIIRHAGHTAHLEQVDVFVDTLVTWLQSTKS